MSRQMRLDKKKGSGQAVFGVVPSKNKKTKKQMPKADVKRQNKARVSKAIFSSLDFGPSPNLNNKMINFAAINSTVHNNTVSKLEQCNFYNHNAGDKALINRNAFEEKEQLQMLRTDRMALLRQKFDFLSDDQLQRLFNYNIMLPEQALHLTLFQLTSIGIRGLQLEAIATAVFDESKLVIMPQSASKSKVKLYNDDDDEDRPLVIDETVLNTSSESDKDNSFNKSGEHFEHTPTTSITENTTRKSMAIHEEIRNKIKNNYERLLEIKTQLNVLQIETKNIISDTNKLEKQYYNKEKEKVEDQSISITSEIKTVMDLETCGPLPNEKSNCNDESYTVKVYETCTTISECSYNNISTPIARTAAGFKTSVTTSLNNSTEKTTKQNLNIQAPFTTINILPAKITSDDIKVLTEKWAETNERNAFTTSFTNIKADKMTLRPKRQVKAKIQTITKALASGTLPSPLKSKNSIQTADSMVKKNKKRSSSVSMCAEKQNETKSLALSKPPEVKLANNVNLETKLNVKEELVILNETSKIENLKQCLPKQASIDEESKLDILSVLELRPSLSPKLGIYSPGLNNLFTSNVTANNNNVNNTEVGEFSTDKTIKHANKTSTLLGIENFEKTYCSFINAENAYKTLQTSDDLQPNISNVSSRSSSKKANKKKRKKSKFSAPKVAKRQSDTSSKKLIKTQRAHFNFGKKSQHYRKMSEKSTLVKNTTNKTATTVNTSTTTIATETISEECEAIIPIRSSYCKDPSNILLSDTQLKKFSIGKPTVVIKKLSALELANIYQERGTDCKDCDRATPSNKQEIGNHNNKPVKKTKLENLISLSKHITVAGLPEAGENGMNGKIRLKRTFQPKCSKQQKDENDGLISAKQSKYSHTQTESQAPSTSQFSASLSNDNSSLSYSTTEKTDEHKDIMESVGTTSLPLKNINSSDSGVATRLPTTSIDVHIRKVAHLRKLPDLRAQIVEKIKSKAKSSDVQVIQKTIMRNVCVKEDRPKSDIDGPTSPTEAYTHSLTTANSKTSHKQNAKRFISFDAKSNECVNKSDSIASPDLSDGVVSPQEKINFCDYVSALEVDGHMTYPAMDYKVYELNVPQLETNKPHSIEKLSHMNMIDPRLAKNIAKVEKHQTNNQMYTPPKSGISNYSMLTPNDPRRRVTALKTSKSPYGNRQQQNQIDHQQEANSMLIYSCLQRSPWFQSLMSAMKIQINDCISNLMRALNNFQMDRLFDPTAVFDVFKIDGAGVLIDVMKNLGISVDSNGIIKEDNNIAHFGGSRLLSSTHTPIKATYSFIQPEPTPKKNSTIVYAPTTYMPESPSPCESEPSPSPPSTTSSSFVSCYVGSPTQSVVHYPRARRHCGSKVPCVSQRVLIVAPEMPNIDDEGADECWDSDDDGPTYGRDSHYRKRLYRERYQQKRFGSSRYSQQYKNNRNYSCSYRRHY